MSKKEDKMKIPKIWRNQKEHYSLIGKKCLDCKELYFPIREVCKNCGSLNMEDFQFSGNGEIETFTIIRTNIETETEKSFRKIPYALAIIKLNEGPKLTAEIVDCDFSEIEIGKKVEFVFRKITEFNEKSVIQYGYKFRLAN